MSSRCTGRTEAGHGYDPEDVSGSGQRKYRRGKYHLRCEAGRRFRPRAGCILPEGLGGWANIAIEYATKRYRSNLINWGMLPFLTDEDHEHLSFKNGDYIFVPDVRKAVEEKADVIKAYVVGDELTEISFRLGDLTDAERQIILDGCLINYYKAER